jgi:ketosteroid isomerase-like protein
LSQALDTVKELYERFEAGEIDEALARVSPDVIWTARIPYCYTTTSREQVHAVLSSVRGDLDWQMHFDHFVDGGDMVVAVGTYSWVTVPSYPDEPRSYSRFCHVWWFGEDGSITRYEQVADSVRALQIMRQPPTPSPDPPVRAE